MSDTVARTIETEAGSLNLTPATLAEVKSIAKYWPMQVVGHIEPAATYGLVFQKGTLEVFGVMMQPAESEPDDADVHFTVNRALIAAALPEYLKKGHRGLMLPCAYHRKKESGKVETGLAFFVGPDPASRVESDNPQDSLFEESLGNGATAMVFHMATAIMNAAVEKELPFMEIIDMGVRPRLAFQRIAIEMMVVGSQVYVVKNGLNEKDPVWQFLVGAGCADLPYAPMQAVALPEDPAD